MNNYKTCIFYANEYEHPYKEYKMTAIQGQLKYDKNYLWRFYISGVQKNEDKIMGVKKHNV